MTNIDMNATNTLPAEAAAHDYKQDSSRAG